MDTPLTVTEIQADPARIATRSYAKSGSILTFRPLIQEDAPQLGRYFLGLSEQTKRKYAPHPFDQAIADDLCARIDYADTVRMIAVLQGETQEEVIAYFILQLNVPPYEIERYAQAGVTLDPKKDCLIAPSVADSYQNQGIGGPLMGHVARIASRLGFRHLLLMGGVYCDNAQAVRFYQKNGFKTVSTFMPNWANARLSFDMMINLDLGEIPNSVGRSYTRQEHLGVT